MDSTNFETWQQNLSAKILDVESVCIDFMTEDPPLTTEGSRFRNRAFEKATDEVNNLAAMYGSNNIPVEVKQLLGAVGSFHEARSVRSARHVLNAIGNLKTIPITGVHYVSFHDIYEKFREEGELNELVDQLVSTLEKIIENDDGTLSSRIEKDITSLLNQIRNRPRLSTYEIGAWADLTGRFLLEIVGQQNGVPALSLVVDAAKLAKKVFDNVFSKYQESQSEYVRLIGLKTPPVEFSSLPILSDDAIRAAELKVATPHSLLMASSSETPHPPV